MIDIAKTFDLVERKHFDGRRVYTLRDTKIEYIEARTQWSAMFKHWFHFSMKQSITRRLVDDWIVTCNRIVDQHWLRKPVQRENTK
jgi:hypothetical protein